MLYKSLNADGSERRRAVVLVLDASECDKHDMRKIRQGGYCQIGSLVEDGIFGLLPFGGCFLFTCMAALGVYMTEGPATGLLLIVTIVFALLTLFFGIFGVTLPLREAWLNTRARRRDVSGFRYVRNSDAILRDLINELGKDWNKAEREMLDGTVLSGALTFAIESYARKTYETFGPTPIGMSEGHKTDENRKWFRSEMKKTAKRVRTLLSEAQSIAEQSEREARARAEVNDRLHDVLADRYLEAARVPVPAT